MDGRRDNVRLMVKRRSCRIVCNLRMYGDCVKRELFEKLAEVENEYVRNAPVLT
jgi:hypothetical protein